ncbi:hypothetical protein MHZ93_23060 [Roseomonas sp. ACRSG]|nr:hypothetical protein [Roseomonas sp. ACRSG]
MNLCYFPAGALEGSAALRVLGPDNPGRLAVSRTGGAQVMAASLSLAVATADTPRFNGAARRLLVEGARSNQLRNPRLAGAVVAGSAATGTLPSYLSTIGDAGGLSWQVTGQGSESGIPYFDLRLYGTRQYGSGDAGWRLALEGMTQIAAGNGQTWTTSLFARKLAGTTSVLTLRAGFNLRSETGSYLSLPTAAFSGQPSGAPLAGQRFSASYTISSANVGRLLPEIHFANNTAGEVVDETYRIGALQVEQGTSASSPILPPAGSLAVSSREADLPLWQPPGGFGTRGTLVVRAMLPQIAPFGASQGLWQIDDGTDQNRIQLRNTSAGSAITGVVDSGGTNLATLSPGNMVPGTPFRAAFAWAPGDQALCLNGGEVQTAAAALPAGLTRLLVGHASTQLNRAAFGEVELVDYRPTRLPNPMLQALSGAA